MNRSTCRTNQRISPRLSSLSNRVQAVRQRMAQALVGQAVSLWVAPETIVNGIVTDVRPEAGAPKIVVGGMEYQFSQVLTSTPVAFCQ